ncbi:MAG: DALR anticodon-binding domain-containing protein, partial [bacterium]|nr:DALR anticodon-binding domain-containing protein [bacterium]
AHARACSILKKSNSLPRSPSLKVREGDGGRVMNLLDKPEELALIKKVLQLPEVVEDIAQDYQVHRLPRYAYELAQVFTNFYEKHQVLGEKNKELTQARLALVSATQKTLKSALALMGISAPEKM